MLTRKTPNRVIITALTALLVVFMLSINCSQTGGNATLIGIILDEIGNPVYGAEVDIDGETAETSQDGSFNLGGLGTGSKTIIISAYGYSDHSDQISISEGENDIDTITMESNNDVLLSEIGNVNTFNDVRTAMEYSGFIVANDTSVSKAAAYAQINGILELINLHKDVTIGQIAEDLAAQGVLLNGSSITSTGLVEILQALINAGYEREGDPRLLLVLYLIADTDGNLPSTPPTLDSYTILEPAKAAALYAAIIFLAENPIVSISVIETFSTLQENIVASLASNPLPTDPDDYDSFLAYFGTSYNRIGGSYAGSLIGLAIGCEIAGGLTLDTEGIDVISAPFVIGNNTITGDFLACKLALWLYKNMWNKVGELIDEEEGEDLVLNEDGGIGFASDIRVMLTWEGGPYTDVDLHVTDPNDEECYYLYMTTSIGGELDVDDVDGYGPENFKLSSGEAISGSYLIEVNYYSDEGTTGEPIQATVKVYINEGTEEEITQEFGPHEITTADLNGTDPDAWWTVTTVQWPSGQFTSANLTERSKIRTTLPPK